MWDLYLDSAPSVLCHGSINVCNPLASPGRPGSQEVPSGTFHQVRVLHAHPGQNHAIGGVVVPQIRVEHLPVNLCDIFCGAEAVKANRVFPISGLRKGTREAQVTRWTQPGTSLEGQPTSCFF